MLPAAQIIDAAEVVATLLVIQAFCICIETLGALVLGWSYSGTTQQVILPTMNIIEQGFVATVSISAAMFAWRERSTTLGTLGGALFAALEIASMK